MGQRYRDDIKIITNGRVWQPSAPGCLPPIDGVSQRHAPLPRHINRSVTTCSRPDPPKILGVYR
jgi:hypothetical protein